ncbi:Predicted arabinose efflux permease, MFS family [Paenibacillus uliginis N3/975]|uniref:Predicted arabinose efflux permease, MFS family n=1 Tax=Paenibacillus uliginis N3/975 TaxID=1313296 RepID=A0A1X7HG47_9BACL|nr:sugar efflux transporter [Paenibacillus uliginis]SMF84974.1 Predicted arabinose efflux permease, MFS family [Paenibacillus uliginis N3/975]
MVYSSFVLLVGVGISITQPYLSLYATEDLGMSAGAFGVFIAVSSLSGVVVNSLIVKRSDSGLDRKWLIILAMLSSALGYASYLVFDNFIILLIVITIFNGYGASAMPQIYAYAQESAIESQTSDRTFAMSTLRSLVSLGFLIGPLVGTLILGLLGYRGLFLGTSAIYLTIASLIFLFLQKRKTVQGNDKKRKSKATSSLKNRQIMQPLIAFTLLFAVNAINGINTPLFIINELQGTHMDVGLVVSISAGLEIPIMLTLGALGRKISNHSLMIIGCFVALIYYSILSISTDSWQLIAAQLLQATYVAIVMGNGLSYFTDLLPDSPGLSTTIYYNGSIIGRLVGNMGGGIIAQFVGFRHVYWACLAIVIFSLFILWRTKPHRESEAATGHTGSV